MNDLDVILKQLLAQEDDPNLRTSSVELCRQALCLISREERPRIWAALNATLASHLAQGTSESLEQDLEEAIGCYDQALTVLKRDAEPVQWAKIQNNLGNCYNYRIAGKRAENIELAISCYQNALSVLVKDMHPLQWARAHQGLGTVYSDRDGGERADNIEMAIAAYDEALTVLSPEESPFDWALVQHNLANAFTDRIRGDRAANLEKAIEHYEAALTVRTEEDHPIDWARTKNALSDTYRVRLSNDKSSNIECAIGHARDALTVFSQELVPEDWAGTHINLASALRDRIEGVRKKNIEEALSHYEQALSVFSSSFRREYWALVQLNVATAYWIRLGGNRSDNLEQAIEHYELALSVYTHDDAPELWALCHSNLALVYIDRIQDIRAQNLEQAIYHCEQALLVYNQEAFPERWAMTLAHLANACSDRIRGDRADNLEKTIHYCQEALNVYKEDAFRGDWALVNHNLGNGYRDRILGDRGKNIERAIACYHAALTVFTRNELPEQWATAQSNLALAYRLHVHGHRPSNVDLAIDHYRQALNVYQQDEFPEKWAMTQINMATAYSESLTDNGETNITEALKCATNALDVYTKDDYPVAWATVQNNMAVHYASLMAGDRQDNLQKAIDHYQNALVIRTRADLPRDHQTVMANLGNLYFRESDWSAAHNAYASAIDVGADLLEGAVTEDSRLSEVGGTARLYVYDAFALIRLGRFDEALLQLERGKTRLLREALTLADLDLSLLSSEAQDAIRTARQHVRDLEAEMRPSNGRVQRSDDPQLSERLLQARGELNNLIQEMHAEHPDFMPDDLQLDELLALIPEGGALVAPLFTSKGSAVFVIPHGSTSVINHHLIVLDDFTENDLFVLLRGQAGNPQLGGWLGTYGKHREAPNNELLRERWFETIEKTSDLLWQALVGKIHERLVEFDLEQDAPVLIMPQGSSVLLPLHAASRNVEGKPQSFLDEWTVTYIPSAFSRSISQRRLDDVDRQGRALIAIVNPTKDLPFASDEGGAIIGMFSDSKILSEDAATMDAAINSVPGRQYVHFSCHGIYEWRDSTQSGLKLAGGQILTLSTIVADLDLSASRLITLSACDTGITDITQSPDEYLGLPAGFLQAGTAGVVSTLWQVSDLSTRLLMERFYKNLIGQADQAIRSPSSALCEAQRWLSRISKEELCKLDPDLANTLALVNPDDKPFASPCYWAAFSFAGA